MRGRVMEKEKAVWFPFLPGRWTFEVVDFRQPEIGEFFFEKNTVYKASRNLSVKARKIVKPLKKIS
jgi:hypothetical protein